MREAAAEHHPAGGGQLGVETLDQDGGRAGEARGLAADVEAGGQVDQQDDGDGEEAEPEDDPPGAAAAAAQRGEAERGGEQADGDQQI